MPVPLYDELNFETKAQGGIQLTIEGSDLSTGSDNLIVKAATEFFAKTKLKGDIAIHLKKNIPMEAGLGGGSANAAVTLNALNEISGKPLSQEKLKNIAASLGSDVPFFLQDKPALGEGRGEQVISLPAFNALTGKTIFLVKPGFGVSTPWAYSSLQRFPDLLNGRPGRGKELAAALDQKDLGKASTLFFNSLEGPVLEKFPILLLFQTKLKSLGAEVTLMSGSGSTTFAIFSDLDSANKAIEGFRHDFGPTHWIHTSELNT